MMKQLWIVLLGMFLFACNKPNGDDDGGNTTTENNIPSPENVSTAISVFLETTPAGSPAYLVVNNTPSYYQFGAYSSNTTLSSNKYKSTADGINAFPGPAVSCDRYFAVTSSSRNYVDVKNINHGIVGVTQNMSTSFNLPGGGKLTYGTNTFITGDHVYFTYINPVNKKFVISVPDMTADRNGKRWLLKSFGTFYVSLPQLNPGGDPVRMAYPIPASLVAEAPDSVQAWYFDQDKWVEKGFAKRTGNSYEAVIHKEGIWNYALPVKGLYKKIRFRTDAGVPVNNAIIRITAGDREVAAARTDADGNAFCFLPVNESLTAEVLSNWLNAAYQQPVLSFPLNPFTSSTDITLTVPVTSPSIATVKGTFKSCSGSPIPGGSIRWLQSQTSLLKGYAHVANGNFSFAFVVAGMESFLVRGTSSNGQFGSDTTVILKPGQENIVPVNTCELSGTLITEYSIDGISNTIIGDTATPYTPAMHGSFSSASGPPMTSIVCQSQPGPGGRGFSFTGGFNQPGSYNSSNMAFDADWIFLDRVRYSLAPGTPLLVTITRYDPEGGFIIGSVDLQVINPAGGTKRLVGTFKVKHV